MRGRRVRLAQDDKWWIGNAGAMLAFRADDGRPVVLLPGMFGRYREVDPVEGRSSKVTARRAEALRSDAWLFYRPLTAAEAGPRDLLRLAGKGLGPDAARFLMAGLLGGLVMLMPAVVLGFVADKVIPRGETGPLFVALAALAAIALVGAFAARPPGNGADAPRGTRHVPPRGRVLGPSAPAASTLPASLSGRRSRHAGHGLSDSFATPCRAWSPMPCSRSFSCCRRSCSSSSTTLNSGRRALFVVGCRTTVQLSAAVHCCKLL